jgi:hypothetical protein
LIKHNEKLPKCQYKYQSAKIKFACNEPSRTNGKFCIFHDEEHYAEHEQEAAKRFEKKVLESTSQNKPLECFGYYHPDVNFAELLRGESFAQVVSFRKATFYEGVSFSEAKFTEKVDFIQAKFSKEVYFREAKFEGDAFFFGATFSWS